MCQPTLIFVMAEVAGRMRKTLSFSHKVFFPKSTFTNRINAAVALSSIALTTVTVPLWEEKSFLDRYINKTLWASNCANIHTFCLKWLKWLFFHIQPTVQFDPKFQMYVMSFHHRFCVFDLPCLLTNSIWFMKFSAPHTRHKIQLFELFPLSGFMIFSSSSISEMHSMIYKVMLEGEGGLIFEWNSLSGFFNFIYYV